MEKTLELMHDELASERRERRVESEEKNAWKDMFTKALASMQGLEKEINFKETKIAALKTRVSVLECEKVRRTFTCMKHVHSCDCRKKYIQEYEVESNKMKHYTSTQQFEAALCNLWMQIPSKWQLELRFNRSK